MRRKEPPTPPDTEQPPPELTRCPSTRSNAGPTWAAAFGRRLQDRQEWRRTHADLLPRLFARDRLALRDLAGQLAPQLVAAEQAASSHRPLTFLEDE